MPTPVSAARQFLTEEAARALDDAVAVARRRSHAQTTSLHAISALLALPSSTLRDACARSRNSPCSSRLQFRALELCVGVSLDRVPSSKTVNSNDEDNGPPISNSLMAAIKRSQANQRRHPDHFHLQQIHCNQQSPSVLKVELKHFILSILDDPIVSRVFGDAGFRSCDIKLAIIHPPTVMQAPRFSRSRCPPPIFLCNLPGSDPDRPGFGYPFGLDVDDDGDYCRRISDKISKVKSVLLLGVCACDALSKFIDCVNNGNKGGILSSEIAGLSVVSIEKEIVEYVSEGGSSSEVREKMGFKFDELRSKLERCSSRGIMLSFGELKVLVGENVDAVSYLVMKLTGLLEDFREKLWLMGAAARHETYAKFLGKFPCIEKDWDLHLLPITSSKSPIDSFGSKSSLMGSFVPFGGFFSTLSDYKGPSSKPNQQVTRCHLCTAKYEQEVSAMLKTGSTISVADQYLENLPSWLQMAQLDSAKGLDGAKTKNDGTTLNSKILGLQKKWNDVCQRLHHAQPFSKFDISQGKPLVSTAEVFPVIADRKESSSSCSRDSSLNESQCANLGIDHMDLQAAFLSKPIMPLLVASRAENVSCQSKLPSPHNQKDGSWISLPSTGLPTDHRSSSSVPSVTTDLGLGTIYTSSSREPVTPKLRDRKESLQLFSGSESSEFRGNESTSHEIVQSSSCSHPSSVGQFDYVNYKSLVRSLSEKVGWQEEAICAISRAISRCKAGYGRSRGSTARGDIWLTFLGPDKVGKKRIASLLAKLMFGSHDHLISVDLRFHDWVYPSNCVFECQESSDYDVIFRGKTIVDYISLELGKRPRAVVLLENVDKADLLVQNSLSQAARTGKFPDSHGREISISNVIFVLSSAISIGSVNHLPQAESGKFSEEVVLGAKSWQMKILIEQAGESSNGRTLTSVASPMNKRKLHGAANATQQHFSNEAKRRAYKSLGSSLDLNLPLAEMEEKSVDSSSYDSDPTSENSQAWLEDLLDQVDEKVPFKPFDFDALADNIGREISAQFQKVFGSDTALEIDDEVMVQMLAASWLSDVSRALEDWVEKVLGRGFVEARQKYHSSVEYVVKVATCKGIVVEERASGICLPSTINL
ncbi:protein SMAX1-LIKE 6-like [Mercurialis annua]|uniref:protein SMAX1-LIKE 6-like n=1 Tax=Mercurialis annua TaxID=3986 RepID=UPI0021604302|nr:protein SMAX1-LIKE 6-like [Mercurialis annua]